MRPTSSCVRSECPGLCSSSLTLWMQAVHWFHTLRRTCYSAAWDSTCYCCWAPPCCSCRAPSRWLGTIDITTNGFHSGSAYHIPNRSWPTQPDWQCRLCGCICVCRRTCRSRIAAVTLACSITYIAIQHCMRKHVAWGASGSKAMHASGPGGRVHTDCMPVLALTAPLLPPYSRHADGATKSAC
jgi:hypothetical protein